MRTTTLGATALLLASALGVAHAQSIVLESGALRAWQATADDDYGGDLAIAGDRLFVALFRSSRVQVLRWSGGWTLEAELTAPDGHPGDWFGYSIAASGTRCLVGAPRHGSAGAAYVFAFDGVSWGLEQRLVPAEQAAGDELGVSVALDGDRAVVGAQKADVAGVAQAGAAFVFERAATWTQTATLGPPAPRVDGWFGNAAALDGELVVLGEANADAAYAWSGAAHAFRLAAGAWTLEHSFAPTVPNGTYGHRLDLEGERLAVGMPYGGVEGAGRVFVYEHGGGGWDAGAELAWPYGAGLDQLGSAVALEGERLVAGSIFDWTLDDSAGSASVFERVGGVWRPAYLLLARDGRAGDVLGDAVAWQDGHLAVGAPAWLGLTPGSGHVYLYELDAPLGARVCRGDGGDGPCPCGNESDPSYGYGCENAYGRGANLDAHGSGSAAADDLVLTVEHLTHTSGWPVSGTLAQLVMGETLAPAAPFGDGLSCLGGTLRRVGPARLATSGGQAWWGPGLGLTVPLPAGVTRTFQVWYRDTASGGCGTRANASNGLQLTLGP